MLKRLLASVACLAASGCIFPIGPVRTADAGIDSGAMDSGVHCPAGLGDCDGDGTCETDLGQSSEDCGRCHRSCLGGTCTDGGCGAVTLAQDQHSPGGIAIAQGQPYWVSDDDSVIRTLASVLPGAVDVVATDAGPLSLTSSGDALFWSTPGSGTVQGLDPIGGNVTTYAFGQSITWGYPAANATTVYWCDVDGGAVRAADRTTGAVSLAGFSNPPHSVAFATAPVWTSEAGGVFTLWPDGGTRLLNSEGIDPTHLAIYKGRAFVCETSSNVVAAIDLSTGVRTVIAPQQTNVHGIAADSAGVYWATDPNVMMYDDDGGVRLFADFGGVHRIALTPQAAYWTEFAGSVRRLAR